MPPTEAETRTAYERERERRRGNNGHDDAADGFWLDDLADADDVADPPRPWIVRDFLLRGAVTTLFGGTGEGKSSVAILWAAALALPDWRLPVDGIGKFRSAGNARVSLYTLEDDRGEQRRRLRATLRQFGASFADLGARLVSTGCDKAGTLIRYDPDSGRLNGTALMMVLRQHIETHRPDVLMLDPMVELHTAPENDNALLREVTAMLRGLAREYNLAVLLMHHARKGTLTPGDIEALRGAGAIGGAVRIGYTVCPMSDADADAFGIDAKHRPFFLRLDRAKGNYSPPATEAEWFEKVGHEINGENTGAMHPWTPPEIAAPSPDKIAHLLAAIARGTLADPERKYPGGEPYSPKLSGETRSVRHLFEQHNITGRENHKLALDALKHDGVIVATFKRSRGNRSAADGLRTDDDRPPAAWIDQDQQDALDLSG